MDERKEQSDEIIQGGSALDYEQVLLRQAYEKKEKGEYEAAGRAFNDILNRFSSALDAKQKLLINTELATLFFYLGEYPTAKRHSEVGLSFGNSNYLLALLGKIAIADFRFALARQYFSKIPLGDPARSLGLCMVAIKLRETKAAVGFLNEAARYVSPDNTDFRVHEIYVHFLQGDTKKSLEVARDLVKKCDHDPWLMLILAEIFVTAGNYGEATALVKKVSKNAPNNDMGIALLAHSAYADEEFGLAESYAKEAVRLNSRNAFAKTILMKLAVRKGSNQLAENMGREIIEEVPEYSLGHANLGDVYFNEGRYELAEVEYNQTEQLMDSQTKGAKLRQARMKFIREDYEAAAQILKNLIEGYHTYYDDAMCDLALCYDKLGDEEKKAEVIDKMLIRRSFYHRTEKILEAFGE